MEDAERLLKEGPGALRPLRNKWSGQAASERFGQGENVPLLLPGLNVHKLERFQYFMDCL